MKRLFKWIKRICIVFLILLLAFAVYFIVSVNYKIPEVPERDASVQLIQESDSIQQYGGSWSRKNKFGDWEAYISGTSYERGVAYGELLREPIETQEKHFVDQIEKIVPNETWRNVLKYSVAFLNKELPNNIPLEYQQEIYGISESFSDKYDFIGPKYHRILNYHAAHDIGHALKDYNMVGCTSFALKGGKTEDGELLVGRNFDFYMGDEFSNEKVVTIINPDAGYKFIMVSWAGFIGVVSGMNENGMTVTINAAKSDIPMGTKTPISILAREILQYATDIDSAYAIAKKRDVFVSESILITSAKENKSAIIEKSPNKIGLYQNEEDATLCTNHYQSSAYDDDENNLINIVSSDSKHRYKRLNQLLEGKVFDGPKAAEVLRDIKDTNELFIGMGNPKSINQSIAHHSVIFKPKELKMWMSTKPYQTGVFVCYDLKKIFAESNCSAQNNWITDSLNIQSDTLMDSPIFKRFQTVFKPIKKKLYDRIMLGIEYELSAEKEKEFIASNPESYVTYMILGEFYLANHQKEKAITYFNTSLSKSVASIEEENKIKKLIDECKSK